MAQANGTNAAADALSADEERVVLVLARAESSLTLGDIEGRLETSSEELREALRSLYRRRLLLASRGIGQMEDTYLLSRAAREHARRLMPDSPRELPIEVVLDSSLRSE